MPMKNCCMLTNSSGQRVWTRVIKGRQLGQRWTTWFKWKGSISHSDIDYQFPTIFRDKALTWSTVLHSVQSFNSGKETTQVAVHEWYRNTPGLVLWSHMEAARDRVAMYNLRWICGASICLVSSLTIIKLVQMSSIQIISKFPSYENGAITLHGISLRCGRLSTYVSRKKTQFCVHHEIFSRS